MHAVSRCAIHASVVHVRQLNWPAEQQTGQCAGEITLHALAQ